MCNTERYRAAYNKTYELLDKMAKKQKIKCLEKYFDPRSTFDQYKEWGADFTDEQDMRFLMCKMAETLQNTVRMSSSIKFGEGTFNTFKEVLKEFEPNKIIDSYPNEMVLYAKFQEKNLISKKDDGERQKKREKNGQTKRPDNWEKYCKGILAAAAYFNNEHKSGADYINHAKEKGDGIIKELRKLPGIGKALPYDFIKEIGFVNYCKPDTHIVDFCETLCDMNNLSNRDEVVVDIIREIANANGTTAYQVDKMIWLVCTENFYLDRCGSYKTQLLEEIRKLQ